MLSHLKVHSIIIIFFFKYRKCHHNKLLKHITSILWRGLRLLIELDAKRMGGRSVAKDDTITEKRGKKITRTRDKDAVTQW